MANPRSKMVMQAGGPRRRILRIGVLLGGKIVEERLIRDRSAVSIGQSAKNTFSVPLEHLPREWQLFSIADDHYALNFTPKMDGRVSDGAQVYTFEQVKGSKATQKGDHWSMPLSDQARGKVSIGDLTLLFQFVTEPPAQPKPMLPASVRGTLAERLDPRLAVICAISIVLHFGIALAAWLHDRPKDRWGHRLPPPPPDEGDYVDAEEITMKPLEPDPEAEQGAAETDKQPEQPSKKPEQDKPKSSGKDKPAPDKSDGGRSDKSAAELKEEAEQIATHYVNNLTFDGNNSPDGVDSRMGKTAPAGDMATQVDDVKKSGAGVKHGGGERGTKGDGDPRAGTTKGPKTDGPGETTSVGENKEEKTPKGRVQVSSKSADDDTTLSAQSVVDRIMKAYMAGIKKCYSKLLKTDPTARGKVRLSFTVNASGRVTDPDADTDYKELSSCIRGLMGSWSFPAPKDDEGAATDASFSVSLQLVPD